MPRDRARAERGPARGGADRGLPQADPGHADCNGVSMPDDRTRHVVAELINSIFDVDKMLYFVAPEWWRPRLRDTPSTSSQTGRADLPSRRSSTPHEQGFTTKLYGATVSTGADRRLAASTVGWGGIDDPNRDNYYITEDSEPATVWQLARLAAAARRRQHAQRLPERPVGEGGHPDPARQGRSRDQLAARALRASTASTDARPLRDRQPRREGHRRQPAERPEDDRRHPDLAEKIRRSTRRASRTARSRKPARWPTRPWSTRTTSSRPPRSTASTSTASIPLQGGFRANVVGELRDLRSVAGDPAHRPSRSGGGDVQPEDRTAGMKPDDVFLGPLLRRAQENLALVCLATFSSFACILRHRAGGGPWLATRRSPVEVKVFDGLLSTSRGFARPGNPCRRVELLAYWVAVDVNGPSPTTRRSSHRRRRTSSRTAPLRCPRSSFRAPGPLTAALRFVPQNP